MKPESGQPYNALLAAVASTPAHAVRHSCWVLLLSYAIASQEEDVSRPLTSINKS